MFTTPCFIRKNTKELRDKIYRLGGRSGRSLWNDELNTLIAVGIEYFRCFDDEWGNADVLIEKGYIDCGTNESLFLAISALNNYHSKHQWFTDGVNWVLCTSEKIGVYWSTHECTISLDTIHKATVDELKEHFKE